MNNIMLGNKTERNAVDILRKKNFWVYNCPRSNSGSQPCDIIAIRGNPSTVFLIDGKHVRANEISFRLSRVEDNQSTSFSYAANFAKMSCSNMGFAIQFERTGDVYWLPADKYLEMRKKGLKSVKLSDLKKFEDVIDENNY